MTFLLGDMEYEICKDVVFQKVITLVISPYTVNIFSLQVSWSIIWW